MFEGALNCGGVALLVSISRSALEARPGCHVGNRSRLWVRHTYNRSTKSGLSREVGLDRLAVVQAEDEVGATDSAGGTAAAGDAAGVLVVPHAPPHVSERCVEQVLEVVVANMEERMKLTTHQAAQAFAAACTAAAAQAARSRAAAQPGMTTPAEPTEPAAGLASLERAVSRLVALPAKAKGRYSLLVVLVPHVGARAVLRQRPSLIAETLRALREETCTAATHFLKELLLQLRQEIGAAPGGGGDVASGGTGGAAAVEEWRRHWVGPLVDALRVKDPLFRGRVVSYALPMLLDLDPESLPELLRLQRCGGEGLHGGYSPESVGPTVAVLLAAHALNLFSSLDAVMEDDTGRCHVPRWVLRAAAVHRDEQLRQQMMELVALHAKTSVVRPLLRVRGALVICVDGVCPGPADGELARALDAGVAALRDHT